MIFEFPFDLIVMTRTNPRLPTHSMLYRQLSSFPLFLVEFSTVSLLMLLPSMRVIAYASYAVAGTFVVGGDAEQDYFADGLTEDLSSELSRLRGDFVIARNTAFTFKGSDQALVIDFGWQQGFAGTVRQYSFAAPYARKG